MVIQCPHCQAWLNLPEHVAGSQVRCAICRHAFWAEAPKDSVQPGSPPKPKTYDEPRPRARARRLEDFDDSDVRRDVRDSSPDGRELMETAKSLARPAGYAMLTAFVLTAAKHLGYIAVLIATQNFGMAQGPQDAAASSICHVSLYGPVLVFIGMGARCLFTLGSRGLIITAIVMNFIEFLLLGGGLVCNTVLMGMPAQGFEDGLVLALGFVSGTANLTAAVMAIRVLTFREVADAYAARAEHLWHWRRY